MKFNRFVQFPLVRTCLFVAIGGWAGMIVGLLLALFGAGVSWLLFRSAFGGVDFATVYAGYAGVAMLLGGLVAAVMSGVVAVRTTESDEEFWVEGDDDECCGSEACVCGMCDEDEKEEVVVVEVPKS